MNLKNGKVFTSKFVGTGPSSYEKRIYRAAVSQMFENTGLHNHLQAQIHINLKKQVQWSEKMLELVRSPKFYNCCNLDYLVVMCPFV